MLTPSVTRIQERYTTTRGRHVLAILALALEAHRAAAGTYPETLAALTPDTLAAVPEDPFVHGRPIYRRLPDGAGYALGLAGPDGGADPRIDRWIEDPDGLETEDPEAAELVHGVRR